MKHSKSAAGLDAVYLHARLSKGQLGRRMRLQLRAGGLRGSITGSEFLADCPAAFSAGLLALALPVEARFISIEG